MSPELVLEDTPHGCQVHYQGRALYGPHPLPDADRRVRARSIAPGTLIVWPSPVLWHGWRELAVRLAPECTVFAPEADPVLHELARRHLPDDPRIVLLSATPAQAIEALRRAGEHRYRRVIEISTTASALTHRPRYRGLLAALEREIRVFWQNRMTLAAMGRLWVRNAIANIAQLRQATPVSPRSGPAVVCGAGPSLEKAIAFIREERPRVTLVAVDTALSVLHGHGVVPDLVVALEGQLANAYDFLPIPNRDYHLVTDLSASPLVARVHPRASWTVSEFVPFSLIRRLRSLPGVQWSLPPLGSVGVAAVRIAADLGCSPILCTGLDFAVSPGVTHARGAPACLTGMSQTCRLRPVPDPALGARLVSLPGASGPVHSTLVLAGYADELGRTIGDRGDVYAIAPFGLSFGATPVSAREACRCLEPEPAVSRERAGADAQRIDEASVHRKTYEFVNAELSRLTGFAASLSAGGVPPPQEIPPALDYLVVEASDRITSFAGPVRLRRADGATWRRLGIAADYYIDRWRTTLRLLEASEP